MELLKKCVQRSKILFFDMLLYSLISIPYEKKNNGGVPSYFFYRAMSDGVRYFAFIANAIDNGSA